MKIIPTETNEPKPYQQGWIEFYKLRFRLTPDVLIPRPETELLVDEVLNRIKNSEPIIQDRKVASFAYTSKFLILDIGTGSGNIAISIAKNLPSHISNENVKIIATDVSKEALVIARQNAKLHRVTEKIKFIQSDLLSSVTLNDDPQASLIIVTNLPYIPTARIPYLDSSVVDFEPHVALDGGEDGFSLYRKLFSQIIVSGLNIDLLLGEIDYTHGDIAKIEAERFFPNSKVEVKTDLAHKQRILYISSF